MENKKECKGVVFRAEVSSYRTSKKGIGMTLKLNPLKRKSCPGCDQCGWIDDLFLDFTAEDIIGFTEIEDKGLYTIGVINEHRDWESGLIDDFDLMVVRLEEEDAKPTPDKGKEKSLL